MIKSIDMDREPIRSLVTVCRRPTVVRLDHLETEDCGWITENYHITGEAQGHLHALEQLLARPSGQGVFLIGHYGSGKSHFLAYLIQQLRAGKFATPAPEVHSLSLLNYRADMALEAIIAEVLGISQEPGDRRIAWSALMERHPQGLLLILDELSEFLRSKPNPQGFNEDIRFLQFMGEWTQGSRFWVLAAMQETIEHTGELEHALYRKIKDRFPLRLLLTPTHVRDLISESILEKRPGYGQAVVALVQELETVLPKGMADPSVLAAVYPLHPATLELLEAIRDRFSQARGIVDFTVTQLGGSEERGVEPFLDRPWGSFLTPDFIIDHFRDLFEVQPEFLPLAQRLFPYYRKQLPELFPKEAQQELAWRIIKLLVVDYLAPDRKGLSAAEATAWLMFAATRIDPARNREIIGRMLKTLATEGRFLRLRGERYCLDLEDDGGAILERLVQREIAELQGHGERVFEELLPLLEGEAFNPFQLPRDQWQPRTRRWHFHERPFAVYLGNEAPPPEPTLGLCLRLPWGEAAPAAGLHTLIPSPMEPGSELVELAAMVRLRAHPMDPAAARRMERRIKDRAPLLRAHIGQAYLEARLFGPRGTEESPLRIGTDQPLAEWLGRHADWLLRRTYPGFERYAPGHGPLPKESFRCLLRFATERDLGEYEADDHVKLIREAYLVPMGLLRRKGRDYVASGNLERHELVKLLLPLLEHRPAPKTVYQHLAEPIYGLMPDQVSLLLLFLALQGVLDIRKGGRSFRDLFETLPNPIQYDELIPGHALSPEQAKALETLCEGFQVKLPKQWSLLTQRQAIQRLREAGHNPMERLKSLLGRLREQEEGGEAAERINTLLRQWAVLEQGDQELEGLQQFLYETGSATQFLAHFKELRDLPERLERLLSERQRFCHLLQQPGLRHYPDSTLTLRLEALDAPPGLDTPDALEQWLEQARKLYADYTSDYRQRHTAWWQGIQSHPIWQWQPPALARSRHLGLEETLATLEACREKARRMRCRGLGDLSFQASCGCGFDGNQAPLGEELARFDSLSQEVETTLRRYFAQASVKERIGAWRDQGLELTPATQTYLTGEAELPEISDLTLLDRHLAGVDLVKTIALEPLLAPLRGRTWERRELLHTLERELGKYGSARLRLPAPESTIPVELAGWCLEQALRNGVALPKGVAVQPWLEEGGAIRCEWVGTETLAQLESMNLGEEIEEQILRWLLQGQLPMPQAGRCSPLTAAALEILQPSSPSTPSDLGLLATSLYGRHKRLRRLELQRWPERLEALAHTPLTPFPPPLTELLEQHGECQWVLIDALGLPLLGLAEKALQQWFPGWQPSAPLFAAVGEQSTTDGCYQLLAEALVNHPVKKIDVLDHLLHQRFAPFDQFCRIAETELELACRSLCKRLDPGQPLLLFADHGFRLATDGRSFQHGGNSTLERVVPLWRLEAG